MRSDTPRETPLLRARWRDLVVVNYVVDQSIVAALAPRGTEPDFHEGRTFLSLVGFLFEDARLAGRVPLWPCATFEEVNLRFYVRRLTPGGPRRGVAFVREIVPCRTIAWGARILYHEPYVVRRMAHRLEHDGTPGSGGRFSYRFESGGSWLEIAARTSGEPQPQRPGSEEEFILHHEWGYSRQRDGGTKEYRVVHPPWGHRAVERVEVDPRVAAFYGAPLAAVLVQPPRSALVAVGSEVSVFRGRRIPVP